MATNNKKNILQSDKKTLGLFCPLCDSQLKVIHGIKGMLLICDHCGYRRY